MLVVNDLMSQDVFTLRATQTLADVRDLMDAGHLRHVPIVDDEGDFVGLLTHRDLLRHTVSSLADIPDRERIDLDHRIPIAEVMTRAIVTARPDMDLREAITILLTNKYGCLPVVVGSRLVGILTEADFLKLTLKLLTASDGG